MNLRLLFCAGLICWLSCLQKPKGPQLAITVASHHPLVLDVALQGQPAKKLAALQWTFSYAPGRVERVAVEPGEPLKRAGKHLMCSSGNIRTVCLVAGRNGNSIFNGTLGRATFFLQETRQPADPVISIEDVIGASADGDSADVLGPRDASLEHSSRTRFVSHRTLAWLISRYAAAKHRLQIYYQRYW